MSILDEVLADLDHLSQLLQCAARDREPPERDRERPEIPRREEPFPR